MKAATPSENPIGPIEWRDLCAQNKWHSFMEIARPLALYSLSVWAVWRGAYGACAVVLLFAHIAALRSAHGAVHNSIGLPPRLNQLVLFGVSGLLATSCHALDMTHKLHHKRCGHPEDVEGQIAHRGFWRACLMSPSYHWRVIKSVWHLGGKYKRRSIVLDLGLALVVHASLFVVVGQPLFVFWTMLLILNGAGGLLSVWLFHRGGRVTRSAHSRALNCLTMGMLYHGEHHQYPAVPTAKLGILARRLAMAKAGPPDIFGERDATAEHASLQKTLNTLVNN